ncbi:unnamed protein product, partial [Rotaria sp. Silwood2]
AQTMRYSRYQSTYDKFRHQWFDFTAQQQELSEQLQKFDDNDRLFQLNYIYDFGSKCRFNRDFRRLWSEYFKRHPILSEQGSKIVLTSKHFNSLNTLLAAQKRSSTIQQ